ncbi:DUF2163 domain-containing protein [Polymorphobacter fuscus]|uniref:DUF2163 domain-containing protein n=1 Tax=Sandarakinorhabdus fusca TaxID=1439888 RepID=A0A7C9KXF8_9SPHN|nr:DUF2163 domain-containing protein [Polymorphobacter fuscus]KAB7649027.1 DUF2163 domain-containing protein [Polymorphobacter fuscus]MQT15688.1 DUF2163 domain-containing protein [Polymorphobacter fuscus]
MAALGDRLTADLTWLALCWRVVRRDGVALGFTTHDRALTVAGLRFESAPGIAPSAVVGNDDLEVDTMDVAGALTADAISAADLAAGRFDGAAVRLFLVDWRDPDAGQQLLARGTLGAVDAGGDADSGFVATLRGPTAALTVTAIESYAPECRTELGDRRCRIAMRGRTLRAPAHGDDGGVAVAAAMALEDFVEGRLRVLDGVMAGIERRIIGVAAGRLQLDEPLALAAATPVQLWQGCDKRFATCRSRFDNAANFRGEPHVPGNDMLTRFGGV